MMDKIKNYKQRAEALKPSVNNEVYELIDELLGEVGELSNANERLRKALLMSRKSSGMSSKLKDALYE